MKLGRFAVLMLSLVLLGCTQTAETPTVSGGESLTLTPTVAPATLEPTPFPTIDVIAPDSTFVEVGSTATLSGEGASGRAVVAGLQTLIIRSFAFDGKDTAADIRLVKADTPEEPIAVLLELEQRVYDEELLVLVIPEGLADTGADTIAIYATENQQMLASGIFE